MGQVAPIGLDVPVFLPSDRELITFLEAPAEQPDIGGFGLSCQHRAHLRPEQDGLSVAETRVDPSWTLLVGRTGAMLAGARRPLLIRGNSWSGRSVVTSDTLCRFPVALTRLASSLYERYGVSGPYRVRLALVGTSEMFLYENFEAQRAADPGVAELGSVVADPYDVGALVGPPEPLLPAIEQVYNGFGHRVADPTQFDEAGALRPLT